MKNVAVVGGGTMGTGIAYVCAFAGHTVTVVEPDATRVAAMQRALEQASASAIKRGKLDGAGARAMLERVTCVSAPSEIPRGVDLAVETVPEKIELKQAVLREVAAREPRIIGTNTSALSIDRLASAVPFRERFLGTHFFNPVWTFKLVELIRGTDTSASTIATVQEFVASIGKESLVVKDVPGFATSRLDLIASLEAMRMLESGVASAEDIDRAAVLAFHHPVGPLRLSDIVGLDVRLDIARVLEQTYGARYAPPQILIDKVARGELGEKSGQGFFNYSNRKPV